MKTSDTFKELFANIIKKAIEENGFDVLLVKGGWAIPWARDGEEGTTKIVLSSPKGQLVKGEGYSGYDPYEESQNFIFEEEEKKKKKEEKEIEKQKKIKKDEKKRKEEKGE